MAGSLFDQLKKSGLVSDKKAKQVQHQKRQQLTQQQKAKKSKKAIVEPTEAQKLAAQAAEEKAARDKALNDQRKQEQLEKERKAELKQIIESNRLQDFSGEIAYQFADGETVKTLYVNEKTQKSLAKERLQIVHFNCGYALVADEVIDRIVQRDPNALVKGKSLETELSEEDKAYYDKFAIPDDLVW